MHQQALRFAATALVLLVILTASPGAADEPSGQWQMTFADDFESGAPGTPLGEPWAQQHPVRQLVYTDAVACSGEQCATYEYVVPPEGSLDQEAGHFIMTAPIPRESIEKTETWRVTACFRFHPEAWTASFFWLRGPGWKSTSLVNSGNLFFAGVQTNVVVWNVAKPDVWYRAEFIIHEDRKTVDIAVGEADGDYQNFFYDLPVLEESVPLSSIGFGYVGALVRYGQGRISYLDDVKIERWM